MKIKNITILKSMNLIALTTFLVFSMNANAASLNANFMPSTTNLNSVVNMSSTNMKVAPAMVILNSVNVWEWLVGLFNNRKIHKEKIRPITKSGGNSPSSSPSGNSPSTGGSDSIPLDGGLSILLAGAAALGVKKLRDYRKKEVKIN